MKSTPCSNRESDVFAVDLGQRAADDRRPRKRDALAAGQKTTAANLADGDVALDALDQQLDQAVRDEDAAPELDDVEEIGVVDADSPRFRRHWL